MSTVSPRGAGVAALLLAGAIPNIASAAGDADIAVLRAELDQMKAQYESRIQALEARLVAAEQAAQRAESAATRPPAPPRETASLPMSAPNAAAPTTDAGGSGAFAALTSGSAFNPQISVILDGNYYQDDIDGEGATLVGEAYQPGIGLDAHDHGDEGADHGHAHGAASNGFNFREAELSFSATVDPYFDAATYISIDGDGNVTLEEAYFETRALPYGLKVKGGRFLSGFGYINRQHPHAWDFVDQNLAYLNLLGFHGLGGDGLQLTWLPDLPVYTLLGVEAYQGDQEVFGNTLSDTEQAALNLGDTRDGPRLFAAYARIAPDLGPQHALQFGLSYAHSIQHQLAQTHTHEVEVDEGHDHDAEDAHDQAEVHVHDGVTEELHTTGLAGDADLWGIDLVYKYDGAGPHGQGDFKLQAEYLRSIKDLSVRSSAHPERLGGRQTFTTDGLYAQALYGFAPKWRAGLRYDVLGLTNKVTGVRSDSFGSSDRWTLDLTWSLSEFSKLRAQYAYNDILSAPGEREQFDAFYLQFLMTMGSHGAHAF